MSKGRLWGLFPNMGGFPGNSTSWKKKWRSALLAPPVWFAGRQAACLHILAVHKGRDHRKMFSWQDRYLGRGSLKFQVKSRRQWIATLVPKQCKEQQSLEFWKSKLLDGQGAHHGVHCLALGLALMVREKSLETWWGCLLTLESPPTPAKTKGLQIPGIYLESLSKKRELKTSNRSFARTCTEKSVVQSIAGLKWQISSQSSSFSRGKLSPWKISARAS